MGAEEYGDIGHVASFMQSFLKEFRPDESFSFTWAETCSSMRPDEFSGGGVFITAEKQEWFIPSELVITAHNNWVTEWEMKHGV